MHGVSVRIVRAKIKIRINIGVFGDLHAVFGHKRVRDAVFFFQNAGEVHRVGRQVETAVRTDEVDVVINGNQVFDDRRVRHRSDQSR